LAKTKSHTHRKRKKEKEKKNKIITSKMNFLTLPPITACPPKSRSPELYSPKTIHMLKAKQQKKITKVAWIKKPNQIKKLTPIFKRETIQELKQNTCMKATASSTRKTTEKTKTVEAINEQKCQTSSNETKSSMKKSTKEAWTTKSSSSATSSSAPSMVPSINFEFGATKNDSIPFDFTNNESKNCDIPCFDFSTKESKGETKCSGSKCGGSDDKNIQFSFDFETKISNNMFQLDTFQSTKQSSIPLFGTTKKRRMHVHEHL
jgi:hypothetical protein